MSAAARFWVVPLGLAAVVTYAAAADEWKPVIVSPAIEAEIGAASRTAFFETHGLTPDGNLMVRAAELGRKIAGLSDRPTLSYQFIVVQGDWLQAWSFPGGTVCLTEKLAGLSDNEVAFALGHELAHIALYHHLSRLALEYDLDSGEFDPAMLELVISRFDTANEMRADRYGALYAVRAGFGFSPAPGLLRKMGRDRNVPKEDGAHPDYKHRAAALEAFRGELDRCVEYFHSGTAALRAGKIDRAIEDLGYFQAEFPQSVAGQINLGAAYLARVRRNAAPPAALAEVLPILPHPGVVIRGSYDRVDLEIAASHFRRALDTDPGHATAHAGLALVYARLGELAAARNHLDEALAVAPDNPELLLCSGNVYYLMEEFDRARSEYVAALSFRAGWAAAEKNLAMSYEELGMFPEAIALWEGLETDSTYAREARDRLDHLNK